jgi:hypothetical protein
MYWGAILERIKNKGDEETQAWVNEMENAIKLPYSSDRLDTYLMGKTRDGLSQRQARFWQLKGEFLLKNPTMYMEVFPAELNRCVEFLKESKITNVNEDSIPIIGADGVSQIPKLITDYKNLIKDEKQAAVANFLETNGLLDKLKRKPGIVGGVMSPDGLDARHKDIVDMVATFLVNNVRECVVPKAPTASANGPTPPAPSTPSSSSGVPPAE